MCISNCNCRLEFRRTCISSDCCRRTRSSGVWHGFSSGFRNYWEITYSSLIETSCRIDRDLTTSYAETHSLMRTDPLTFPEGFSNSLTVFCLEFIVVHIPTRWANGSCPVRRKGALSVLDDINESEKMVLSMLLDWLSQTVPMFYGMNLMISSLSSTYERTIKIVERTCNPGKKVQPCTRRK
jgi:hypothetical protein